MEFTFNIIQIVLAAVLMTLILVQGKGAGLSEVFGGSGNVYAARRGAEATIFWVTVVVAVLFFGFTFARLFI